MAFLEGTLEDIWEAVYESMQVIDRRTTNAAHRSWHCGRRDGLILSISIVQDRELTEVYEEAVSRYVGRH